MLPSRPQRAPSGAASDRRSGPPELARCVRIAVTLSAITLFALVSRRIAPVTGVAPAVDTFARACRG